MTASCNLKPSATLVDAHVHIHSCFDLGEFLNAAFANFQQATLENNLTWPCPALLLLTETANSHYFDWLKEKASASIRPQNSVLGRWRIRPTKEKDSLCVERSDGAELVLIAGRQIVSVEGLEVLALATTSAFADGEPIRQTISAVTQAGGVPVIPWGFGKWSGRRGRILNGLLREPNPPEFFLGDNSGRLRTLPAPTEFTYARNNGIRILPGTDPLPFRSQQSRAGSYGFWIEKAVSAATPASDLKKLLTEVEVYPFGRGEGMVRFATNQLAMQVLKRFLRHSARGRRHDTTGGH